MLKDFTTGGLKLQEMLQIFRAEGKTAPDGNTGLQKGRKSTGNDNYVGKPIRVFLIV